MHREGAWWGGEMMGGKERERARHPQGLTSLSPFCSGRWGAGGSRKGQTLVPAGPRESSVVGTVTVHSQGLGRGLWGFPPDSLVPCPRSQGPDCPVRIASPVFPDGTVVPAVGQC